MKITDEDRWFAKMLTDFLCLPELEEWQVWVLARIMDGDRPSKLTMPWRNSAAEDSCQATYLDAFAGTLHCGRSKHISHGSSPHVVAEGPYAGTSWEDGLGAAWKIDPSLQGTQQKLDTAYPEPDGLNG